MAKGMSLYMAINVQYSTMTKDIEMNEFYWFSSVPNSEIEHCFHGMVGQRSKLVIDMVYYCNICN